MHLFMTAPMEMYEVVNPIVTSVFHSYLVMGLESLTIQEIFTAARTFPLLCLGHQIVL